MVDALLQNLQMISVMMPLPVFILVGSILEEVIAVIPSPFVLTLGGSILAEQRGNYFYLLILALLAAGAKTFGAYVYYLLADKLEDVLSTKFGKYVGVSHASIEKMGKRFGQGNRDEIVIFLLRAVPLLPTAPVSLAAGAIKINIKHYLLATYAGLVVRCVFFLYLGYTARGALGDIQNQLDSYTSIGRIIILALLGIALVWFWQQRRKHLKD